MSDIEFAGRRALFISWVPHHGRSAEIAAALDIPALFLSKGPIRVPRTAPLRYLSLTLKTLRRLVRSRPEAVLVMLPPFPLAFITFVFRPILRYRLVLDLHSAVMEDRRWAPFKPFTLRICAKANLTLVTNAAHKSEIEAAGGRALVLHDSPQRGPDYVRALPANSRFVSQYVLAPLGFGDDEPIEHLIEAAELLPDVKFVITGQPPTPAYAADLTEKLPTNVDFLGFLPRSEFLDALAGATVILALTTRPRTMQRAGYEALLAQRALVASNTDVLREYFGAAAVYADDSPKDLAASVEYAFENAEHLRVRMAELQAQRSEEWKAAISAVIQIVETSD